MEVGICRKHGWFAFLYLYYLPVTYMTKFSLLMAGRCPKYTKRGAADNILWSKKLQGKVLGGSKDIEMFRILE